VRKKKDLIVTLFCASLGLQTGRWKYLLQSWNGDRAVDEGMNLQVLLPENIGV
jgi:hypothetical protein